MKKVIWTPTARISLQDTYDFLVELWNEKVAEEFLNQLDYRISQIQKNPELAPTFELSEFRQLLIHKTTSLFYRNFPGYIKLLLVWDTRQNQADMLNRLTDANN
jgi:plasmid stabilization system protein ParE